MTLSLFSDEHYMKQALEQAKIALEEGEVPVGAVIVSNNKIIAKAYNQVEKLKDATAHAEILAITAASERLGSKYLDQCTLYVTLEPCGMCAGASSWAQVKKVVFGASDENRGYRSFDKTLLHPKAEISTGILAEESKEILNVFFKKLRE